MLGITKAYTTRVGSGPFPTELDDEIGETLGRRGKEFGTVTARKRRCGWFDGVLVRQTIKISGINGIALTKLDVLDETKVIRVCVEYNDNKPVFKEFDGWLCSTEGITQYSELPDKAKEYIEYIETFVNCSASMISTGPSRDQTIFR